jgi:ribosome-binding protein aMBF1 (putative translation factor)
MPGERMDCILCGRLIRDYHPVFNHLEIDESHAVDVCSECVHKFVKWQQTVYANLFPTKAAKKRFGKI